MKIKSSVGKNVNAAVANCRKVLVEENVNLLKSIGAEDGQDVLLGQMLFLYQRKGNTTETVVCDRIAYGSEKCASRFYFVSIDDNKMCQSSIFLSIDSLMAIYEAVRKVVREE
jgi:hypothetical protein